MTREEKLIEFIRRGFTYDPETGDVFGVTGKPIRNKHKGYIDIAFQLENKRYTLRGHQFAWYWVNKECVDCLDHINGNGTDNRICNLRSVTNQENTFNNTKAKGYCWSNKHNKFISKIQINNKEIYLGSFDNKEDARSEYLEAKEKYHIINNLDKSNDNFIDKKTNIKIKKENFKGYYYNEQRKKYIAQIRVNNKVTYLGSHSKEEDARSAYSEAVKQRLHNV